MIGTAANNERDGQSGVGDGAQTNVVLDPQSAPSMRVVTAIVEATDADPTTMTPLYHAVDTDALDTLLEGDTELEFVFDYEGHEVVARDDGSVAVDGTEYEVL